MKRASLVLMLLFCTIFLGACADDRYETGWRDFPWAVILHWNFELNTGAEATQQQAQTFADWLEKGTCSFVKSGENLDLRIEFETYKIFRQYFGLGSTDEVLNTAVWQGWESNLFIRTRTLVFDNPWESITGTSGVVAIQNKMRDIFSLKPAAPKYEFELYTSFVRNIDERTRFEQYGTDYRYFFAWGGEDEIKKIQIMDRYENGAIWYAIAFVATAIFMVVIYIVFKKRENGKISSLDSAQVPTV